MPLASSSRSLPLASQCPTTSQRWMPSCVTPSRKPARLLPRHWRHSHWRHSHWRSMPTANGFCLNQLLGLCCAGRLWTATAWLAIWIGEISPAKLWMVAPATVWRWWIRLRWIEVWRLRRVRWLRHDGWTDDRTATYVDRRRARSATYFVAGQERDAVDMHLVG